MGSPARAVRLVHPRAQAHATTPSPGSTVSRRISARHGGGSTAQPRLDRAPLIDKPGDPGTDIPEHLSLVWRLANGVANDFNNLLQVIGGNAESILEDPNSTATRKGAAQSILDAANRASVLTRQLQSLGRRRALAASPLDLYEFLHDALPALRRRVTANVKVVSHLTPKLPPVRMDADQLHEVLAILADNARDSMSAGGTLSLMTDLIHVGPRMQRLRPWLRSGPFVRIEMADDGVGVDAETLAHVFEPFYATAPGCGVGLGLAAAYGIIKQSNGFIWLESEPGHGSRVTILLPVSARRERADSKSAAPTRVLLVEDDQGVRELLDDVLMQHGFSVTAYGSAEEALRHVAPYDVLVTDAFLPGVDGPTLAREVRRGNPKLPVLLMSGDAGRAGELDELDAHSFLQKPFSAQALLRRVEELLSA